MSMRQKAFLKQAKSARKKEQKLDTADDYQAAGVDHEDAAGKWRAGDPQKSMRFFQRAIEVYEQGLQRFPTSFDLAYNKARVELELATHPILVKQLSIPVLDALQISLQSHQYALTLDQDNIDTIFNTSQVLTSIAEEIAKDDSVSDDEALQLLQQALEMQNRCLELQELKYQEQEQQLKFPTDATNPEIESDNEEGGASLATSTVAQEDQWFSIVEPITQDTIIDTLLAQLGSLTTLCGILSNSVENIPQNTLLWIEEYSTKLLEDKLSQYTNGRKERLAEIALARAIFVSSLLEVGFRSLKIDVETYKRELDEVFALSELELPTNFDALVAKARALISWNAAVAETVDTMRASAYGSLRWHALNTAMTTLTTASKSSDIPPEDKAQTHLLRGDISLLQYQLSYPPITLPNAVSSKQQLTKNARVYYVNAGKLSASISDVANGRAAIAQAVEEGNLTSVRKNQGLTNTLEDMINEGLVPVI